MRFFIIPTLILLIIDALVDFVVYKAIVRIVGKGLISKIHIVLSVLLNVAMPVLLASTRFVGGESVFTIAMWTLYLYLCVYIPKIIFIIFYSLSNLPRIWRGKRIKALGAIGAVIAIAIFATMLWGALFNRFNINVVEEKVEIPLMPEAFDGFTVAQISDLHVGTLGNDTTYIAKLVDCVNSLNPDVIVFTGDIVNQHSGELKPFVKPFSRLKAKYGVYSVMGNHDYGDYTAWPEPADKETDVKNLRAMQAEMGWTMLNDSTAWIKAGNDSIAIIGVENVGDPPFKVYGSLKRAYPNIGDGNTKILLSHNPAHWDAEIMDNPASNIALTLSGHTHAMQIELFGWSPAAWRYNHWGGMYTDSQGQRLYVNIGAGSLGMPARIGANPEITLFTLKTDNQ